MFDSRKTNAPVADTREQTALRESEERYRSLVEATAAIVWNTPASGEFETPQPGWSAFTGQAFEQLKGWGWLTAVHPDDQQNTAEVWATAVAQRAIYKVEHRLRRADGTYRHMSVRAVPIVNADGTIREWIGIHNDVTDRRTAEEDLRQTARALEQQTKLQRAIVHSLGEGLVVADA